MICIDMPMPTNCGDCRFCECKYTDDDDLESYAYCCATEKYIAQACDGKDIVVSTAMINKPNWCVLNAQNGERRNDNE